MSRAQLIEAYLSGVGSLRLAVDGLSPEQRQARPGPGGWSILEVVCHLADTEALFTDRMKRVLVEDRPPLIYADATAFVAGLACSQRDLSEEVELFGGLRRQMARILAVQPDSAWSRIGIHSRVGEQTLEQLLQKSVDHLEHHLDFIHKKRAALAANAVHHISITIQRPPAEVYAFAADPGNLPRWAAGLARSEVRQDGDSWIADAPFGKARIRFARRNDLGVLDHDVTLESGVTVHNPMRVIPRGEGSEFLFSLFRQPGMSDEDFQKDKAAVEADLQALKQLLERS